MIVLLEVFYCLQIALKLWIDKPVLDGENEYSDLKIAIFLVSKQDARTTDKKIPIESDRLLDPNHIFHEKAEFFTDSKGDRIAFSGSNNESLCRWEKNIESFHVYCD